MDKNIESQSQTKIQLSLAALMFFSPLVQNVIKRDDMELTDSDKSFISGYIKFGYISLIILAITATTGMINYRMGSGVIDRIYTVSIIVLTIILVIGAGGILTNTNILTSKKELIGLYNEQITTDKREIVLSYLPIMNIYKRYQEHNFDASESAKPNLLLKESFLAWGIFIALGLLTTPWRTSTFLILIIIRVASLMGGMDIVSPQIKGFINTLFLKNPEELRGYIKGSIIYLYKKVVRVSLDKGKGAQPENSGWDRDLQSAKQDFSLLYNVELQNSVLIKTQYAIGILVSILLIRRSNRNLLDRTKYIPLLILLGRYVIMLFKRHHLPPLPIFKEITDAGMYLYEKTKKHTSQ